MADDRRDFGVNQFLRNRGTDFRVSLIVLGQELDFQYFTVDLDLLRVRLIDCQANAVFIILAQVRDGTRQRSCVRNLHRNRGLNRCFGFRCRFGFFFAATHDTGSQHRGE